MQDGAEWIQGFVDLHRPDAVRILDFAHAAGYLSEIAELVRAAGTRLPEEWLAQHLHELKHHGPAAVLKEVSRPTYFWVFQLFGETLGKALPSLVKQTFDIRRRVRAVAAREERQHGHTWLL